ncbi:uncharacterized protein LOC126967570 [Leptidea sinapis]|uniref:uncharacterized protein LOC126967570 n=1 Tax=Leptidea sinapis TaxID=189913 RepID=UPI0021C4A2E5|nr:uncharacterized protein LOC126967570 [Leptidea sinapis]
MRRMAFRPALWALALLSTLAPSYGDGNIGCLFSPSLCLEGVEWCYDDFAFGKCIPIYENDLEEDSLFRYDMGSAQLQWFEGELQRLATRGYRWEHAYTQCVLQSMLYALKQKLDPENLDSKICDNYVDSKLNNAPGIMDDDKNIEPDETAYIRFMPNSPLVVDSNYANEVYNPLGIEDDPTPYILQEGPGFDIADNEELSNKLTDAIVNEMDTAVPLVPFSGFRERLRAERARSNMDDIDLDEYKDKEKKSVQQSKTEPSTGTNEFSDEERLGAHFRKYKTKPPPYTAEYLTGNRYSPLDDEVRSNALEKYRQSFAAKNFPFEYENPGDMPESRIYFDEDGMDDDILESG